MSNHDIYQKVTDVILDAMDKGVVPWKRPWRSKGAHRNLVSKRPYRGVNQFLCEIQAQVNGYNHPYWLSFKQVKAKKGKVLKGEKGTLVVFWKMLKKELDEIDPETGKKRIATIPLLRYYYVFNVAQCEGISIPEEEDVEEFNPIDEAQTIVDNMPLVPETFHCGDRAFYTPSEDTVTLPVPEAFHSPDHYYSTRFHEYAHSTGHESRLGRVKEWTGFDSDPYANEELVAELTAAMLCGISGIEVTHEQSASYIKHWSDRLRADAKLIVSAAGQAQKAADFMLGVSFEDAEKEVAHVS